LKCKLREKWWVELVKLSIPKVFQIIFKTLLDFRRVWSKTSSLNAMLRTSSTSQLSATEFGLSFRMTSEWPETILAEESRVKTNFLQFLSSQMVRARGREL
jgi:hypothetical protein